MIKEEFVDAGHAASLPLVCGAYAVALAGSLANALLLARRIPREERLLSSHREYRTVMMARPRLLPSFRSPRRIFGDRAI